MKHWLRAAFAFTEGATGFGEKDNMEACVQLCSRSTSATERFDYRQRTCSVLMTLEPITNRGANFYGRHESILFAVCVRVVVKLFWNGCGR